MAFYFSFY